MTDKKIPVLFVDDQKRNLHILQQIFQGREDIEIHLATNGEEALQKSRFIIPSVIILDIMMPGIDGYEVCRQIRANPCYQLTKIILVSGKSLVEERIEGYAAGADDYLTKPFVPEELEAKFNVFLRLFATEKKLSQLNQNLEEVVQRRTEELLASEKMAYIGMHSAEIVHNLKNPLAVIQSYSDRLQREHPESRIGPKLERATNKLAQIIGMILNSTRNTKDERRGEVDLNAVIESEFELLSIDDFAKYKVHKELVLGEIPKFVGVVSHFSQIFGNLIKNALESMGDSEDPKLIVSSQMDEGQIVVRIEDSGCGMSAEVQERIFEPLYTTKRGQSAGEPTGTGLGLSYVKKMVEVYGGEISVESVRGRGTVFTIKLVPDAQAESEAEDHGAQVVSLSPPVQAA